LATAFVQDSGDQSEAAGELVSVRGTDATIDRADDWATFDARGAGVKAAALLRPAIKMAALLIDNLILFKRLLYRWRVLFACSLHRLACTK